MIGASNHIAQSRQYMYLLISLDEIAAISQTTFTNAFSWMKSFEISIQISLKFLPKGILDNESALFFGNILAPKRLT